MRDAHLTNASGPVDADKKINFLLQLPVTRCFTTAFADARHDLSPLQLQTNLPICLPPSSCLSRHTSIAVWPAGANACCGLLVGLRRWMSLNRSRLPLMNWSLANSQRSGSTLRKPCICTPDQR